MFIYKKKLFSVIKYFKKIPELNYENLHKKQPWQDEHLLKKL